MRYPCYNRKKQLFGAGTYKESAVSAVLYGLAAGGIYLKQVNWKRCYVTVILVGINIAIYILGIAAFDEVMYDRGSLNAQSVLAKKELYRMVSCMFLHAGIDHLVGNMIFLAALGEMLEPKIGHLSFGSLYMISGIGSSIASLIYRILTMQFYNSVGASGAINGLIGALLFLVVLHNGYYGSISPRRIVLAIAYMVYSGLQSTVTDNAAHIGGLVCGFFCMLFLHIIKQSRHRG